jgi:hypothetical protein
MTSLRLGISLFSCDTFALWLGDYEKPQCLDLILRDSLHTEPCIENITPVLGAITPSLLDLRQMKIAGPLDLARATEFGRLRKLEQLEWDYFHSVYPHEDMEDYESIKGRPALLFEKVFIDFEKPPEVVITWCGRE